MLLQIQCLYYMTVYLLLKHLAVMNSRGNSLVKNSTYIYRGCIDSCQIFCVYPGAWYLTNETPKYSVKLLHYWLPNKEKGF